MNVRRIDFPDAEIFIDAAGDFRGFRSGACAKEPETAGWIRGFAVPGRVLFDVGACVGSYSLVAGKLGATVHAFEPVAHNYSQLQQNILLNDARKISAWPVACTALTGPVNIQLASTQPGSASHRVTSLEESPEVTSGPVQPAMGIALDRFVEDFSIPAPTELKIDVDGGETGVLEGARRVLRSVESVMVETDPRSEQDVTGILQAVGLVACGAWPRSGRQVNRLFRRADT